jgi:hypothetical protein
MKVKLILPEKKSNDITFPCLMQTKVGRIVLMNKEHEGTVIKAEKKAENNLILFGRYSDRWDMTAFTPLPKGSKVILEQE